MNVDLGDVRMIAYVAQHPQCRGAAPAYSELLNRFNCINSDIFGPKTLVACLVRLPPVRSQTSYCRFKPVHNVLRVEALLVF